MDFMQSYITDCLQNAESSTISKDSVVQVQGHAAPGQGQRLVNLSP